MKGIYVLIIKINTPLNLKIGALGKVAFPVGLYAYVGSAQNNIESRINRHLRKEKNLFWHIDHLLTNAAAEVIQIYYQTGDKACECQTAQWISKHSKPNTKLWMLRLPLQQPPISLKQFHFPQRTHEPTNNTKNITYN